VRPTRRGVVGAGLALTGALAAPACAEVAMDAAPPATDAAAWTRYEGRLRARMADAGGEHFDEASARAALQATNAARRSAGAPAVAWHEELAAAARAHAGDLAARNYVEHLSPEGFDPSHRFWLLGRTTIGSPSENIAYHRGLGPPAPAEELLLRWKNSPGHWRNLLRPSHTHAAYGVVRGRDRVWMVGLYARPVASLAEPRPRVAAPQGSRAGKAAGAPPVMQITAIRRVEATVFDVVGGPIFVAAGE
jgi:uncharacterized protein YkwD